MIKIKRTNSDNIDFQKLANELDVSLEHYYKEENAFYAKLNNIEKIKNAVVAYDGNIPVGCGGIKEFSSTEVEVKRMYIPPSHRKKGIASIILRELETWGHELKYQKCVLETLKKKPYAIKFYEKNNYKVTPNFGDYKNAPNSICFIKELH